MPDTTGWSRKYEHVGGFAHSERTEMSFDERITMLFIDFNMLVTMQGIDPKKAHREFLKIDEYRKMIPADARGADSVGGFQACRDLPDVESPMEVMYLVNPFHTQRVVVVDRGTPDRNEW